MPVGGDSRALSVTADGRTIVIPSFVAEDQRAVANASCDAVYALVPPAILANLEARHHAYMNARR